MRSLLLGSILAIGLTTAGAASAQSSDTIRDTQQALKDKGFDPGPIDGKNGPKTRAALRKYQTGQSMTATGRMDGKTLEGLGVKGQPADDFKHSGEVTKKGYSKGGKEMAEGTKEAGSSLKDGKVTDGAVEFGKGVGKGAAKMGVATGHAAKDVGKGVKKAFTPSDKTETKP